MSKMIAFYFNDQLLWSLPLKENFNEQKVQMSLVGLSTEQRVHLTIRDLRIFKAVIPSKEFQTSFHSNVRDFSNAVQKYDQLHTENSSISNLYLIEGRIEREIDAQQGLLEIISKRQQVVEQSLLNE